MRRHICRPNTRLSPDPERVSATPAPSLTFALEQLPAYLETFHSNASDLKSAPRKLEIVLPSFLSADPPPRAKRIRDVNLVPLIKLLHVDAPQMDTKLVIGPGSTNKPEITTQQSDQCSDLNLLLHHDNAAWLADVLNKKMQIWVACTSVSSTGNGTCENREVVLCYWRGSIYRDESAGMRLVSMLKRRVPMRHPGFDSPNAH
ncbi:hypothetical protein BDW02DRAFT_645172 [Decorospora gaudefroyi]|uniref:Uncharacterized protein n=1 Tax=Decorospora gaudefroyi TaxID=184978 RepID=A0A6A5KQU3_9PLEO|nr:hypothetical protein BDW02DRAFT_645172 [Decorospora gaudefroyi]